MPSRNTMPLGRSTVPPMPLRLLAATLGLAAFSEGARAQTTGLTISQRSVTALGAVSATDQHGQSFAVGGLSGLTYAGGSTFWAVMDNSDKLVKLDLSFALNGSIVAAAVSGGATLALSRDHEGIAIAPGGLSAFVSDESDPAVREYRLSDGALLGTAPLPAVFANRRSNFGLESLSRTGQALWTANEEALSVDGPLSDEAAGTTVRLQRFDLSGSAMSAGSAFAYRTGPIHKDAKDVPPRTGGGLSRSGLSDLVALPDGRFLALERSFARADLFIADAGSDYNARIYLADPTSATDIAGLNALEGLDIDFLDKSATPLWSNTSGAFGTIGNLEGLALGPQLANGNFVLLGVVDDGGGSDPLSGRNRLVSFELAGPVPEPGFGVLALGALATLARRPARLR